MRRPILAIDPGPEQSGWVLYHPDTHTIGDMGIGPNHHIESVVLEFCADADCVIEMVTNYGKIVGKTVFETCVAIGRLMAYWEHSSGREGYRIYRPDVTLHLCNAVTAKAPNVRQVLIDRFPATGGGKTPQIGIKKQPGPLYGMKSHLWAALAVAVTWAETKTGRR